MDMVDEPSVDELTIVGMVVLHHDTSNGSIPFKGLLGLESFFHVRCLLEIDKVQRRVVLNKNGCKVVSPFGEKASHVGNQTVF